MFLSLTSSPRAPAIAPGIVPITIPHARRSSTVWIPRVRIERIHAVRYRTMSRQKYTTAPTNVPMCRATSKVLFKVSLLAETMHQWKSHGTRMRWPELDTGANSVSPWTMPRTIAWNAVR